MFKNVVPVLLVLYLVGSSICQSDDDEMFLDDEIVVNPVVNKTEHQQPSTAIPISTTISSRVRQFKFDAQTMYIYRYELLAICGIFFYLLLYRWGKSQNIKIMQNFYRRIKNYVQINFSHIGFTKVSGEDPFVAESPSQAMFYASGRQNIQYMEIKFNMMKRQDLIYHFLYETIYPEKDLIIIDISVQINHPIVFCVVNKKKLKQMTEKHLDLAKLAGTFEIKGLNPSFHVLGQAGQIFDAIFDTGVLKKINDVSSIVHSIHYTDQNMFSENEGHIRAILFASRRHEDKYLQAVELLLLLADRIHEMKIPAAYKAKAFKAREAFNATVEKERLEKHKEELKKQKDEKKKKEEAWLRSLPPEKQKREDEKRKKKEINKMLKSRVMKVA